MSERYSKWPELSPQLEAVVQRIKARADDDPEVIAAHLQGTPGPHRGFQADLQLVLGCTTKAYCHHVREHVVEWFEPVTTIAHVLPSNGGVLSVWTELVTADGYRIDLMLQHAEFCRRRPLGRILKETPGHFAFPPESIAHRSGRLVPLGWAVSKFWCHMTLVCRATRHEQLTWGLAGYLNLLDRALLIFAHWKQVVPPEARAIFDLHPDVDRILSDSFAFERLTPATLAEQYLKLARLVQQYAPRICDENGVSYRVELEAAVMGRLRRELIELGVDVAREVT